MPQFRILIAVTVDAGDFNTASFSSNSYVSAVQQAYGGSLIRDARVLKIEDVSPPALDTPTGGVVTSTGS